MESDVAAESRSVKRRARPNAQRDALHRYTAGRCGVRRTAPSLPRGAVGNLDGESELWIVRAANLRRGCASRARDYSCSARPHRLALSPDDTRIAMLALGRLWLIDRNGVARAAAKCR